MNKLVLLSSSGMVDTTLENAAAMAMGANSQSVLASGIIHKLSIFWTELCQALLNDMVAVEVLDERDDIVTKSGDNCLDLGSVSEQRNMDESNRSLPVHGW